MQDPKPVRSASTRTTGRRIRVVIGLVVCAAVSVRCHQSPGQTEAHAQNSSVHLASAKPTAAKRTGRIETLAQSDPLAFFQFCLDRHETNVRDYRCTFTKQERIGGKVRAEQEADVRYRSEPFSVDMTFTKNVGEAARALYVAGAWKDRKGNPLAWVRPAGAIIKAFIPKIRQPIHGKRASKASRRSIADFGFEKTLDVILHYSQKAAAEGSLDLRYTGWGDVDQRPTYVFERLLPFTGDGGRYPDRLLVIHVDQEYLVPTACLSYGDAKGKELLGRYVYTDIQLNPGYAPDAFDPDAIGF